MIDCLSRSDFFSRKEIATPEGRNSLNNKFKFCTNLTKPEDVNDLFGKNTLHVSNAKQQTAIFCPSPIPQIISEMFMEIWPWFVIAINFTSCRMQLLPEKLHDFSIFQVNYPYPTSFLAPLPANPVTEFCAFINATYTDDQLLDVSPADWCPSFVNLIFL